MLLGLYIASRFIERRIELQVGAKTVILLTAFAILTRTLIMFPIDYTVFGALVSVVSGLSMPDAYAIVRAAMPEIILYNITVPLYVVPTSYYIAKKLSKSLKIQNDHVVASKKLRRLKAFQISAQRYFEVIGFAEALAFKGEKSKCKSSLCNYAINQSLLSPHL